VLKKDRNDLTDATQLIYTQSVDRATTGMVVLSFYFEKDIRRQGQRHPPPRRRRLSFRKVKC
jgi:hypothetical protein